MKNKNGVSFGLLSGIFWGLGLTISAYIFSIFTNLSPFVVAAAHDFLSIFILLAFLLVKERKVRLSIFLNIRNVSVIIGALLAGPIGMQANLYAVKYIGSSFKSYTKLSIRFFHFASGGFFLFLFFPTSLKNTRNHTIGGLIVYFPLMVKGTNYSFTAGIRNILPCNINLI